MDFREYLKVYDMLKDIDKELRNNIDFNYKRKTHHKLIRYKDYYGVRTSINRNISLKYFEIIKELDRAKILNLCNELLESGIHEKKTIAFDWAFRIKDKYIENDFYLFESWLYKYVNNYGLCDDLCKHALGEIICQHPSFISKLYQWIKEETFWVRRGAPVTLIYLAKRVDILDISFNICKKLFDDKEDLVQKGFGWLLKELSENYGDKVFNFLYKYKEKIPRVAFRYAVEKMPGEKRQILLSNK